MPKRRSDDQLALAWAKRELRPNLDTEPFKSDSEAKAIAQDEWLPGVTTAPESERLQAWRMRSVWL